MTSFKKQFVDALQDVSERHFQGNLYRGFDCLLENEFNLVRSYESHFTYPIDLMGKEDRETILNAHSSILGAMKEKPQDFLGSVYMEQKLNNARAGQFFTPYALCQVLSGVASDKTEFEKQLHEKGFVECYDGCCGAGALLIAYAESAITFGIDKTKIRLTGWDLDIRCCMMAYIQTAMLGVSHLVVHGDTLKNTILDLWAHDTSIV